MIRVGVDNCGAAMDLARDVGRPRGVLPENCVFSESISAVDGEYALFQAIHQESDVVPENVDAVRALAGVADATESRRVTDCTLGVDAETAGSRASGVPLLGDAG